jgi:hypothetical protein
MQLVAIRTSPIVKCNGIRQTTPRQTSLREMIRTVPLFHPPSPLSHAWTAIWHTGTRERPKSPNRNVRELHL